MKIQRRIIKNARGLRSAHLRYRWASQLLLRMVTSVIKDGYIESVGIRCSQVMLQRSDFDEEETSTRWCDKKGFCCACEWLQGGWGGVGCEPVHVTVLFPHVVRQALVTWPWGSAYCSYESLHHWSTAGQGGMERVWMLGMMEKRWRLIYRNWKNKDTTGKLRWAKGGSTKRGIFKNKAHPINSHQDMTYLTLTLLVLKTHPVDHRLWLTPLQRAWHVCQRFGREPAGDLDTM